MGMFDKYDNIDPEYIPNNLPSENEDKSIEINPHGVYDITGKLIGYTINTFDSDPVEINIDDYISELTEDMPEGESLRKYLDEHYTFELDIKNLRGEHIGTCNANVVNKDKGASLTKFRKIRSYLWEIEYKSLDEEYARLWLLDHFKRPDVYNVLNHRRRNRLMRPGCSSMRVGPWHARNFDWNYDHNAEFVIRVPSINGSHSSIGVCKLGGFNPEREGGDPNESTILNEINKNSLYKILPFYTVDGINDCSVTCNINVCPSIDVDGGSVSIATFGDVFPKEPDPKRLDISMMMVCRYILDRADSAREACRILQEDLRIHMPYVDGAREDIHIMISDNISTYIVEFITDNEGNNVTRCVKCGTGKLEKAKPLMTNFYLLYGYSAEGRDKDVIFDEVGKVTVQNDGAQYSVCNVTPHGMGMERFNRMAERYNIILNLDKDDQFEELKALFNSPNEEGGYSLRYSNAYTDKLDYWKTEFVGLVHNYTTGEDMDFKITDPTDSPAIRYWYPIVVDIYNSKQKHGIRPAATWQTVHTSIYELDKQKLHLLVQEDDKWGWHEYKLSDNSSADKTIKDKDIVRLSFNVNDFKPLAPYDKINKNEYSLLLKITYKGNDGKVYTKCIDNHQTLTIK